MDPSSDVDILRLQRERDLYRRLLDIGGQKDLRAFLREALALVVELTGARQGYLELHDDQDAERRPRWSIAHGLSEDEIEGVRSATSRGIVAEAVATGQTIVTASALLDPRFRDQESVRVGRIEAVLCAPIGADPPVGVLYLQGRPANGPFSAEDRTNAEIFARHLAPLVDQLLIRQRAADPTAPHREKLRVVNVVGRSRVLATLLRQVALVAPLDVHVLLTGESGTGKSQIARVIHDNGPRAPFPFVALNCAALPETLIESELFGAAAGAHSTATRRMDGKVAAADGGTLLLDEIGDLSLQAQAKVLHLLQSKQYYPLGTAKPVHANVRLIAATNVDLQRAVAEKRFREDLLYRLQVVPMRVPSLRERRDDVAELAAYFCAAACERHGLPWLEVSRGAIRAAESAEWPGNVRQLAHAVEAAVIRATGESATSVERTHLFPDEEPDVDLGEPVTFQEATRRFQARLLRDTLKDHGWNVMEVARKLDLARSHVYNLIHAFGLTRS